MKIFRWLSYFIIIIGFVLGIYILFLLFYPLKPIVFYNLPFPVQTKVVKRGESLIYTASHCKFVTSSAIVSRSLVDTIKYTLPEVTSSVPRGCNTFNLMVLSIPALIPPGEYYLAITLTYHLNPFRTYTVDVQTEKFTVVE